MYRYALAASPVANALTISGSGQMAGTLRHNDMVFALVTAQVEALVVARRPDIYNWNQQHNSCTSSATGPEEARFRLAAAGIEWDIVVESYAGFFNVCESIIMPASRHEMIETEACVRAELEAKQTLRLNDRMVHGQSTSFLSREYGVRAYKRS